MEEDREEIRLWKLPYGGGDGCHQSTGKPPDWSIANYLASLNYSPNLILPITKANPKPSVIRCKQIYCNRALLGWLS